MSSEQLNMEALKINLFFLRIMKEHALFIMLGLPPKEKHLIDEAKSFNEVFDSLLLKVIGVSKGYITFDDIYITAFTKKAEEKTASLTGANINIALTTEEKKSVNTTKTNFNELDPLITNLNNEILFHLNKFIEFKAMILIKINNCSVFAFYYPSLFEHIKNEAIIYAQLLVNIQNKINPKNKLYDIIRQESFWDHIISQHGQFISGFLDPSEKELIENAQKIVLRFTNLKNKIISAKSVPEIKAITKESITATKEAISYKESATKGILDCKIKSIIIPLLSDHLIREAAFYLDLLEEFHQEVL